MDGTLPFMRVPHDTMREGLPGAKAGVSHLGKHPVQLIQEQGPGTSAVEKRSMLANTYGIAMPARMDIEAQILGRQNAYQASPPPTSARRSCQTTWTGSGLSLI